MWETYKLLINQCVCPCIISCYSHLCVGSHFTDTRRLYSYVIFPPFIALFPPNALQFVYLSFSWAYHLNVVNVIRSDESLCLDRQPKKRPLSEAASLDLENGVKGRHRPSVWGGLEWPLLFPHKTASQCLIYIV